QLTVGPDRLEIQLVPEDLRLLGAVLPKKERADDAIAACELHPSFEATIRVRGRSVELCAARCVCRWADGDSTHCEEQREQGVAEGREVTSHGVNLRAAKSGAAIRMNAISLSPRLQHIERLTRRLRVFCRRRRTARGLARP